VGKISAAGGEMAVAWHRAALRRSKDFIKFEKRWLKWWKEKGEEKYREKRKQARKAFHKLYVYAKDEGCYRPRERV